MVNQSTARKLLDLCSYLESLPPESVDLAEIGQRTECGTFYCALGHAVAKDGNAYGLELVSQPHINLVDLFCVRDLEGKLMSYVMAASIMFDLDEQESFYLFEPRRKAGRIDSDPDSLNDVELFRYRVQNFLGMKDTKNAITSLFETEAPALEPA